MKKLGLLFILLLFFSFSCRKSDKEKCIDSSLISSDMICTEEYDPVCGCDGVTYDNACVAKFNHGVKFYDQGACNCNYEFEGVVEDLSGLDGCDKVIVLPDSSVLEVASLPEGFKLHAGAAVEFNYSRADSQGSICMVGEMVHINCIREVYCKSISETNMLDTVNIFTDPIYIKNAEIVNDCIYITFSYPGGCHSDHDIELTRVHPWCGTPPLPPPFLLLRHNRNDDYCKALITRSLSFDLRSLREPGKDSVKFNLGDFGNNFNKTFIYKY